MPLYHISEETRRKISEAKKGKPLTEEHKAHIRETFRRNHPKKPKAGAKCKLPQDWQSYFSGSCKETGKPCIFANNLKGELKLVSCPSFFGTCMTTGKPCLFDNEGL